MLFILTFFLSSARRAERGSNDLTNTGILQITWLLGNDSHFATVQKPETQILREAGMFEVEMDAMAQEKMNRPLDNCEIVVAELSTMNSVDTAVNSTC